MSARLRLRWALIYLGDFVMGGTTPIIVLAVAASGGSW